MRWLWIGWLCGLVGVAGLFGLVWLGVAGPLPDFAALENPHYQLATVVYDEEGEVIGRWYTRDRVFVDYDEISPWVIRALVATEDSRFYRHSGIDWRGTVAAVVYTIMGRKRGGSTITQQLAKNLFPRTHTGNIFALILTKLKEWVIAVELERRYTKREILWLYLNIVPFGGMIYGIKNASEYYFGVGPDSLRAEQAALLIGMLKGTSYYNPFYHPDRARARRNVVLYRMYRVGYLTREEYDSLSRLPLGVRRGGGGGVGSRAPYFQAYVKRELMRLLRDLRKPDGTPYNLYEDGLRVYTTLNLKMQRYARAAVRAHLGELQEVFWRQLRRGVWKEHRDYLLVEARKTRRYRYLRDSLGLSEDSIWRVLSEPVAMQVFTWRGVRDTVLSPLDSIRHHLEIMQVGVLAVDLYTGGIRVWVGGPDFRFFQYDHVVARRQVGSTIKPFIYSLVVKRGWTPCRLVPNIPVVFEDFDFWSPKNAGGVVGGEVSLVQGLAYSLNIVTAYLVKILTPTVVSEELKQFGFTGMIPPYPSIVLGTPEIPLLEMVQAFTVFGREGTMVVPYAIERVEDRHGNVLYQHTVEVREVLSREVANTVLAMLRQVVDHGTAVRLRYQYRLEGDIAGKTGTTEEHADGWFIGLVPGLVAGVWVGWEYPFLHFRSMRWGQGATMALPIWAELIRRTWSDTTLVYKPGYFPQLTPQFLQRFPCIVRWQSLKRQVGATGAGDVMGGEEPDLFF